MMKNRIFGMVAFFCMLVGCLCVAQQQEEKIDWEAAQKIRPGVRFVKFQWETPRDKPLSAEQVEKVHKEMVEKKRSQETIDNYKADVRPMKIYVMRIDLTMKGLTFTGTGRAEGWGEKMPDHAKQIIRTRRLRTAQFMKDCRKPKEEGGRGLDMIVANNSAPWSPWESPYTHKFGNPTALNISDGVIITDNPGGHKAILVVYKNGKIDIVDHIDTAQYEAEGRTKYDDIWFAHSGFGIILKNGETTPQTTSGYDRPLMPRMTCGLDKDRHYMYLVAVDGRLFGWSEGATGTDLVKIMRAAGAYDVIDFDGGGSATLCYWDDEKKAPQTVNRHDRVPNGYYRPCGMNMGLYIKHDE
jgi:hypothetical protein